ncbi:hypothetical protein P3T36_000432 [Kitasatospora sp. MAP12-15]|uniref:hypothetical protein n=1 Tax=unclassified Kitasatospora TaxID=2633591 RepID=UPI002476F26F|nr:hypothetical protein [Kitasatospora sp. MAP12-44]MDH6109661.1 hypothetical protein [Kitasatospora sp. MAP12-44]
MRVILTRDSVCMGDDCYAPHEYDAAFDGATTLGDLVDQVVGVLPQMRGARWVMFHGWSRADGTPIAEVSPEWADPRFTAEADRLLPLDSLAPNGEDLSLFFQYHPGSVPLSAPPAPAPSSHGIQWAWLSRKLKRARSSFSS